AMVLAVGAAMAAPAWAQAPLTEQFEAGTTRQLMARYAARSAEGAVTRRVIQAQPLVGSADRGDRGPNGGRGIRGTESDHVQPRYVAPAVVTVNPPRNSDAARNAHIATNPASTTNLQPAIFTRETLEPVGPALDDDIDVLPETDQVELASSGQLAGPYGRGHSSLRHTKYYGHRNNYGHGHVHYRTHRVWTPYYPPVVHVYRPHYVVYSYPVYHYPVYHYPRHRYPHGGFVHYRSGHCG